MINWIIHKIMSEPFFAEANMAYVKNPSRSRLPEPLSGNLQGEYSRRINEKERFVYQIPVMV